MKYLTLAALLGFSKIKAIDFDGDGVDDTPERPDDMDDGGDEDYWYEDEQYEDLDYYEAVDTKEFVMLAAMNADMTADADGNDELGVFKVGLFKGNQWERDIFYTDLSDPDSEDFGNYVAGWTKTFADEGLATEFEVVDDCYLKMYLEELDSNDVKAFCEIDLPCTNTAFAYAPCWLKGTEDNGADADTNEERHGYYMLTYSVRDVYMMEDWAPCDIFASCGITIFGKGFWCSEY